MYLCNMNQVPVTDFNIDIYIMKMTLPTSESFCWIMLPHQVKTQYLQI